MRIALYDDRHFSAYGAQRVVVSMGAVMAQRGWQPTLVTGKRGQLTELAEQAGLAVHVVPVPPELDIYSGRALEAGPAAKAALAAHALRYAWRIGDALDDLGASLVLASSVRPALYCAMSRIRSRRRIVWFVQGGRDFGAPSFAAGCVAHQIMLVSNGAAAALPRVLRPVLLRKALVNSPGVDLARFPASKPDGVRMREALGVPTDALLASAVGSIEHRKGFDVLLEALELARQRGTHLHLVIAGTARGEVNRAFDEALRQFAASHALPVIIAGYVEDVPALLAASDLFVLSSRLERHGLVTLEAMASSVPVIVTRAGGAKRPSSTGSPASWSRPTRLRRSPTPSSSSRTTPPCGRRLARGAENVWRSTTKSNISSRSSWSSRSSRSSNADEASGVQVLDHDARRCTKPDALRTLRMT